MRALVWKTATDVIEFSLVEDLVTTTDFSFLRPTCTLLGIVNSATLPPTNTMSSWTWDAVNKQVVATSAALIASCWGSVRTQRNSLLSASDGMMLRANETGVNIDAWKSYRQALRDIPKIFTDPDAVVWPTAPAS